MYLQYIYYLCFDGSFRHEHAPKELLHCVRPVEVKNKDQSNKSDDIVGVSCEDNGTYILPSRQIKQAFILLRTACEVNFLA